MSSKELDIIGKLRDSIYRAHSEYGNVVLYDVRPVLFSVHALGEMITVLAKMIDNEQKTQFKEENRRLRDFLTFHPDGHAKHCNIYREGFEGCDETMFNCSCGYEEELQKALKGEQDDSSRTNS